MDYLKSYIEIHLKYWYCYIGILPLIVVAYISAIYLIRIIGVLINLEVANTVGYNSI